MSCCCVAAGFDASYMDPLGHMMLGSEDYRYFTAALQQHAATSPHCQVIQLLACMGTPWAFC
jgi:acetoin utilization deacetylase AcuC-like enzyme